MSGSDKIEETADALADAAKGVATRRGLLRIGAVAVPALVTMKPAFANQVSVLNCQIPVPNSANSTKWIKNDGTLVASGTSNSFPGPSRNYTGQEILTNQRPSITMKNGQQLTQSAFNAHVEYIKKLQRGTQGFTCFASVAGRRIL
jgi:hypothetical protein